MHKKRCWGVGVFADLRGGALDKKEEGGVLEGQRGGIETPMQTMKLRNPRLPFIIAQI